MFQRAIGYSAKSFILLADHFTLEKVPLHSHRQTATIFFTVTLFLCSLPNDTVKKIKKKPSLSDPCPFIWSSQILPKQAAGYPKTLILFPTVNLVSSPDQLYNDLVLSKYRIITPLSLSHFSCPSPGCPPCPNPTTGPK